MPDIDAGEVELTLAQAEQICAVPAPTGAEDRRGAFVSDLLRDAGAEPSSDAAGNVLAEYGDGSPADAIVLAAHLDTVFAADTDVVARRSAGRVSAPGIGDNSLGVAALVHLARRLRGRALGRRIVLAATVGEEGLGDLRGAKALVAARPWAGFVAVEGMMLDSLTTGAVGSRRYQMTVRGPGGHPWSDQGSPSAVHGLLGPLQAILAAARDAGAVANLGLISGGTAINVIAVEASAELDLRSEDEAVLAATAERVIAAFDDLAPGLEADVQELGRRPGGRTDPAAALLATARQAREQAGLPVAEENASSTDANAAHGKGIPAVTVGITTGANAHRLDEYVDTEPIPRGLVALDVLVDTLAGDGR